MREIGPLHSPQQPTNTSALPAEGFPSFSIFTWSLLILLLPLLSLLDPRSFANPFESGAHALLGWPLLCSGVANIKIEEEMWRILIYFG